MNTSGDAAEQVVRLSIEGVEMAAKLVGSGAKELATFLYAVLRDSGQQKQQKGPMLIGRERLSAMLKSGKELKVFALKEADLKAFCKEARRFGVGYYVVRARKKTFDGLCDVMVPAEQASMVARIVERFGYQPDDRATLQTQVEQNQQNLAAIAAQRTAPPQADPTMARGNGSPRAPGSTPKSNSGAPSNGTVQNKKPSVKDRLYAIAATQRSKAPAKAPQRKKTKTGKKKKGGKSRSK